MNESDARSALLLRACETTPHDSIHWTENDRAWATQAAQRVEGEHASADSLIARRARLGVERLCSRDAAALRALRAVTWRPWIGWVLALLALAAGVATDALAHARSINVLAPPLLAVLAWNLTVYLLLALRAAACLAGSAPRQPGPLRRWGARITHALASARRGASSPIAGFLQAWTAASAPLTLSRVTRILHMAALAFAAGALLGIYLRGFAFEYRAGWESTFLDAGTVHRIIATVLGPASRISGIALPDAAGIAALRLPASTGENAARWIHLYALTVSLFVILPRALLALWHFARERRLAARFPLPLDEGYFQAIVRAHRGEAALVHVVPYSYRPGPQAALGLNALMVQAYGVRVLLTIAPVVPFGGEDTLDDALFPAQPAALVALLFSLTATPEQENHSAFIDTVAQRLPLAVPLAVIVDESAFRQHFGVRDTAAAPANARLDERREAWRRMLAANGREALFVDLGGHDFSAAAIALHTLTPRAAAHTGPV